MERERNIVSKHLYEKGNVDLFREFQLKDDYKKYVEILKLLIEGENSNE